MMRHDGGCNDKMAAMRCGYCRRKSLSHPESPPAEKERSNCFKNTLGKSYERENKDNTVVVAGAKSTLF